MKKIFLIIGLILIFILMLSSLAIGAYGFTLRGGELAKGTGLGGQSSGCYVSDKYFADTSDAANEASIISQIQTKWPVTKGETNYLQQIFSKAKEAGINPLMALGVWAGEQTFANPEKAFGYGYKDSGTISGVTSWDAQLNGVFGALQAARDSISPYDTPESTDDFTRFYYHYTTAMKNAYEASGNTWSETGEINQPVAARLAVFHLVAPNELVCKSGVSLANVTTGNNGVPLIKQADYPQPYGKSSSTLSGSGCCVVSATMVLIYNSVNVDPVGVGNFSYAHNCYVSGDGTDTDCLFKALASEYTLHYDNFGLDWNKAISYLSQNKPLLAHGKGSGPFTTKGHCIVITGYDLATKLFNINNPANTGNGPYSQDELIKAGIVGMFYLGK